jgi:hypothetical protein
MNMDKPKIGSKSELIPKQNSSINPPVIKDKSEQKLELNEVFIQSLKLFPSAITNRLNDLRIKVETDQSKDKIVIYPAIQSFYQTVTRLTVFLTEILYSEDKKYLEIKKNHKDLLEKIIDQLSQIYFAQELYRNDHLYDKINKDTIPYCLLKYQLDTTYVDRHGKTNKSEKNISHYNTISRLLQTKETLDISHKALKDLTGINLETILQGAVVEDLFVQIIKDFYPQFKTIICPDKFSLAEKNGIDLIVSKEEITDANTFDLDNTVTLIQIKTKARKKDKTVTPLAKHIYYMNKTGDTNILNDFDSALEMIGRALNVSANEIEEAKQKYQDTFVDRDREGGDPTYNPTINYYKSRLVLFPRLLGEPTQSQEESKEDTLLRLLKLINISLAYSKTKLEN